MTEGGGMRGIKEEMVGGVSEEKQWQKQEFPGSEA